MDDQRPRVFHLEVGPRLPPGAHVLVPEGSGGGIPLAGLQGSSQAGDLAGPCPGLPSTPRHLGGLGAGDPPGELAGTLRHPGCASACFCAP